MRSLFEAIIDSDDRVLRRTEDVLIYKLIENLKYCNNLSEFIKLWTTLCPKLSNTEWSYRTGSDGYVLYRNIKNNNRIIRTTVIVCHSYLDIKSHTMQPSITIFGDEQGWSNKNECARFVKNVAKSLKADYEKDDSDWYQIKF